MKRTINRMIWIMVLGVTPFLAMQAFALQEGSRSQGETKGQESERWGAESRRTHPWEGMREHWRRVPRTLEGKIYLWERFVIGHRHVLGLTEQQVDEVGTAIDAQRKYWVAKRADHMILIMEIQEMLVKEPVDLKKVEEKVKAVEALSTDIFMEEIRTLEKVLSILTPDQRKTVEEFMRESTFTRRIMAY